MTKENTHSTTEIHKEHVFEEHVANTLLQDQGYLQRECEKHYNSKLALDTGLFFQFLKSTQTDMWKKLEDQYSASAETVLLKRLEKALRESPTHVVIREGIKMVPDIRFTLCYFNPASNLNLELKKHYEANILSVMRQVFYSTKNNNSIDMVLFVNGIPVVTMEVKNHLTGQNYHHAERQYRTDRSPAGEPLLTFQRGAIVHFAVDQTMATMTTRLKNGQTRFLPFNRGRDGGAGNPDLEDENATAYLYKDLPSGKAVFSREVILDLIGRFVHLEKSNGQETLIFPRFQQLDAVRKILDDAKNNGAGKNYLIQHSAGSGKSNTIAWTAHQIINLHNQNDEVIFDTAIIVTDRIILDRQLQNTISGHSQVKGVVKTIDGTSRDLKKAIEENARIIITTIQKFGTEHLAEITSQSSKNFAVIVDEAHSSQSGKAAEAMGRVLANEDRGSDEIEDIILSHQEKRGPQPNISYFAFTATPRNVTLERFGQTGTDGIPYPFHLYSMKQAIEEGFILDVLQNYSTYESYYKLEKAIEDDPSFESMRAHRKVARYASLHPTAIDQKVEVIVEHFRRNVSMGINGLAKAMVVTQSREHALKYWKHINSYIQENEINDIRALVAFSGDLQLEKNGQIWTEASANEFSETELPAKFDTSDYQILVVAEKYQTGFDQPKLAAMYVDKNLSGLQAVQTLSRLNRTHPGKTGTYILDFQNKIEDIRSAFKPYFEATTLEERTDFNQIYDLEGRIMQSTYLIKEEIEQFSDEFYKGGLTTDDRIQLEGLVRQTITRFNMDEDEASQEEFRQLIKSYMRFYSFVAQIVKLDDTWLEKLYVYLSWLDRLLPSRNNPGDINITDDMLDLSAFKLELKESRSASLSEGDTGALPPITEFGANKYTEEEEQSLSEIISSFNERHGTHFTQEDFLRFEQVNRDILDDDMIEKLKNNPADVVYGAFKEAFFQGMIHSFQQDNEMRNIVMSDQDAREQATRHFFKRALRQASSSQQVNI